MHGTTIIGVRTKNRVVIAGDGQVTLGHQIIKNNAKKVRRLARDTVLAGFAGSTADAFALFERLELKLEKHPGQLTRACVELAKDWRTDRALRQLEAMMIVADKLVTLVVSGNGDVLDPEDSVISIGSGGGFALAAGRALFCANQQFSADEIAQRSLLIAADICIYSNSNITLEGLDL
jgi:ATP-dependent HslUV protease subunit HslV